MTWAFPAVVRRKVSAEKVGPNKNTLSTSIPLNIPLLIKQHLLETTYSARVLLLDELKDSLVIQNVSSKIDYLGKEEFSQFQKFKCRLTVMTLAKVPPLPILSLPLPQIWHGALTLCIQRFNIIIILIIITTTGIPALRSCWASATDIQLKQIILLQNHLIIKELTG